MRNISFSELVKHPASSSLSHNKRALSLTVGFYLGLFPVLGCTTVLCLAVTLLFRLNSFLVLAMNFLLAPVQVLLMVPFIKFGQLMIFGHRQPNPEITWRNFYQTAIWDSAELFLEYVTGGILLWAFLSLFTGLFVYRLFYKYSTLLVK